jgi:hypothetical protein
VTLKTSNVAFPVLGEGKSGEASIMGTSEGWADKTPFNAAVLFVPGAGYPISEASSSAIAPMMTGTCAEFPGFHRSRRGEVIYVPSMTIAFAFALLTRLTGEAAARQALIVVELAQPADLTMAAPTTS